MSDSIQYKIYLPWSLCFHIILLAMFSHDGCGTISKLPRHSITPRHFIAKRSLSQMCRLITLHTNSWCYVYNGYGCFCGYGNKGTRPVDSVDSCCQEHDECYGDTRCWFPWYVYEWMAYNVDCSGGAYNCVCTDSNSCSYDRCQCDIRLAECLGNVTDGVHDYYRNYNRQLCY